MTTDAERTLNEMGWPLEEVDFGREDEPDISGCLLVGRVGEDSIRVRITIRPGLEPELRDTFAVWASQRIQRFVEHGTEPDGWQHRSDGDWQLWARGVDLPPLD